MKDHVIEAGVVLVTLYEKMRICGNAKLALGLEVGYEALGAIFVHMIILNQPCPDILTAVDLCNGCFPELPNEDTEIIAPWQHFA